MKFIVSRTSEWDDNKHPCEEAKYEEIPYRNSNRSTNCWVIEINTLEELISFIDKYGEVVIFKYCLNESYKEIEIYDDYRE